MATVIIPWRADCPHREASLPFVLDRLRAEGHEPVVSECPPGPWIKALAVMPLVPGAEDVVVVHDADVVCHGLSEAIKAVESGAPWAVPHLLVKRLSQSATEAVLAGGSLDGDLDQEPYPGVEAGGVLVVRRDVLLDCPFDPRFQGWGGEDHALGFALSALYGPPWRGTADLWHLWHPHPERVTRHIGCMESERLRRRYLFARALEREMRALVEEAKAAWPASSSST